MERCFHGGFKHWHPQCFPLRKTLAADLPNIFSQVMLLSCVSKMSTISEISVAWSLLLQGLHSTTRFSVKLYQRTNLTYNPHFHFTPDIFAFMVRVISVKIRYLFTLHFPLALQSSFYSTTEEKGSSGPSVNS